MLYFSGTQFTAGVYHLNVIGGKVDHEKSVLNFTESTNWVYVGTITKDKRVIGTATRLPDVHYFSMAYNP